MNEELKKYDKEFKKLFLLKFTKELIKNSSEAEIFKLKKILEGKEKEIFERKEKPREYIQQRRVIIPKREFKRLILPTLKKEIKPKTEEKFERSVKSKFSEEIGLKKELKQKTEEKRFSSENRIRNIPPVIRIPKPIFPQKFSYLKPPQSRKQIDLDKLNPLIIDPIILSIECGGANRNLIIRGSMGTKKTNIILNEEEIDQVIRKFSEITKIPLNEGVFRVVYEDLLLNAIISKIAGTKFIIQKIISAPKPQT